MLVGVWTDGSAADADASLAELAALAETAGSEVLEGMVQRRTKPDPATYIGSGKAAELRDVVLATGADTVICDGELSPAQLTALERAVKVKVIDRTALILAFSPSTPPAGKARRRCRWRRWSTRCRGCAAGGIDVAAGRWSCRRQRRRGGSAWPR